MRFFVPIGWPQINEDYLLELATDWDEAAREAGRVGGELSDSVFFVVLDGFMVVEHLIVWVDLRRISSIRWEMCAVEF